MGTWFAFIIFPCVAGVQHWCVPRSGYPRFPKKLRVSESGLCIAQGRLRFADSRDRSSLIFSGFPNSAVVSVRLTGGVVERLAYSRKHACRVCKFCGSDFSGNVWLFSRQL